MLQVFCPSLVVYENVNQIHHYKTIGERSQDIIHHPHKHFRSIFQTKGHDQPFKNTFFSLKGDLPHICMFYWELVVARLQINLNEVFVPHKLIKEVIDSGNRVPVSNRDFIQSPIINLESPGPIFIIHQYDWAPTKR
jgi:hypothetical protein